MDKTMLRLIKTNRQSHLSVGSERTLRQSITAVPDNSNIRYIRIGGVAVNPELSTAISTLFARMPFLRSFSMKYCDCSNADGLSILLSALANKASLEWLYLEHCRIGNSGAEIIVSSFGANTTLTSLTLEGNSIDNDGAIAIASFVSKNSSIEYINLKSNLIGAGGMNALARSLGLNRSVTCIYLNDNQAHVEPHFKRVMYDDSSIENVVSSNHTLKYIFPPSPDLHSLLELNRDGPEQAVQSKIVRFLNERPTFVLSMGIERNVMPIYMGKVGRHCQLNTMFVLISNVPGLSDGHKRPRKRSIKKLLMQYVLPFLQKCDHD